MPRRQRRCGGSAVMSRPSNAMRPVSTRTSPQIRLNSVVLPAPLGPRMPSVSPASTASEIESVTFSAPKDLLTPCSASRAMSDCAQRPQLSADRDVGRRLVVDDGQLDLVLAALAPLPQHQRRLAHVAE